MEHTNMEMARFQPSSWQRCALPGAQVATLLFFGAAALADVQIVELAAPLEPAVAVAPAASFVAASTDGHCSFSIDTSKAPELKEWAEEKLAPVLAEWYPKIAALLADDRFVAPERFSLSIAPGSGVAATSGTRITANSTWIKRELHREAIGAIIHEVVHVVHWRERTGRTLQELNEEWKGVLKAGLASNPTHTGSSAQSPAEAVTPKLTAGNPVFDGWYADPEGIVFGDRYWIYPTYSAPYHEQVFFDAFSSPDLIHWTKHSRILDTNSVAWARRAMWAPSVIAKDGRYFFFFGANDIQNDQQLGGIGVAVADKPEGPFKDHLGKPLIDRFHNGAQPIDQFAFRDSDGQHYLIYGGWRHCNVARLRDDFRGLDAFPDGTMFKEITPRGYVEGPFMFKRNGKYYFMWSEGGWTGPDYSVAYAIADSPLGPFERIGKILQQDPKVATGAGHHSVIKVPNEDTCYIVYHRRPLGETDGNHRVTCIDRMEFDDQGFILPVKITFEGVAAKPLTQEKTRTATPGEPANVHD